VLILHFHFVFNKPTLGLLFSLKREIYLNHLRSSSNTSLSTVTQNGVAKARGHLIGETVVTASMNRALHNFGTAIIRVAPALSLDIIDDHVREVEVGKKVSKYNTLFHKGSLLNA